jgi:hypothetical protein
MGEKGKKGEGRERYRDRPMQDSPSPLNPSLQAHLNFPKAIRRQLALGSQGEEELKRMSERWERRKEEHKKQKENLRYDTRRPAHRERTRCESVT